MPARPFNLVEAAAVLLAAPFLLFPTLRPGLTAIALALLAIVWVCRWVARREPWPLTPMNGALLLFCVTVPVGVWASPYPDLTIPKLTGLILGLAVFRVYAFGIHSERALTWGLAAFGLVGLGILAGGLIGAGWQDKFLVLKPFASRIPHLAFSGTDINPNQLAGAMALYLPVAVACAAAGLTGRRLALAVAGLLGTVLAALALVLTQSRGGWLGALAGLAVLALLWALTSGRPVLRRAAVVVPLLLLLLLVGAGFYFGLSRIGQALDTGTNPSELSVTATQITMAGRVEIWSRALYAIQDFPFTGPGLGAFRRLVPLLYPLFSIPPDQDIAHAHNIFLQTALDLGLTGLVAYMALLLTAITAALRGGQRGNKEQTILAFGLIGGVVALQVYGMTDSLALGSKPGVALWAALGLVAGLVNLTAL